LLPLDPEDPIILMNGDLVVDVDFSKMLDFHNKNGFYATMAVHPYFHEVPYGCAEINDTKLINLIEKPIIRKNINAGLYVLSPSALKGVPKNTFFPVTDLFEDAIKKGYSCGAFPIEKEWIDIGKPKQLKQARGEL
jgi:NDP-sugar pyrophosphorylase family protein